MDKDEIYQKLLKEAESDSNIIGFVLSAGRGRGFVTENSDYDIAIVVPDEMKAEYVEKYEKKYYSTEVIDIGVYSLTDYKNYAKWGEPDSPHRYNFAYLKAQIDRTGEIQKIINEKGIIPPDKIKEFVSGELDSYINYYYRAVKNYRDGSATACYFDGVESMFSLLAILFGVEGRLRPYNKYLEWDLKNHPLKFLPWPADDFVVKVKKIMTTGDIEIQKEIFKKVCELFRAQGYGEVIDGWEGYYLG